MTTEEKDKLAIQEAAEEKFASGYIRDEENHPCMVEMIEAFKEGVAWRDENPSPEVLALVSDLEAIVANGYVSRCWTCDGGSRNHDELVEALEKFKGAK